MSLERFDVPRTPESRTPYVLALLAILASVRLAWDGFIHFRFNVEALLLAAAAVIGYATWRFVKQRGA